MSTQRSLKEKNGVLQEIDLFLRALFLKDIQSLFGSVINGSMSSCSLVSGPVNKVKITGNFNNLRFSRCLAPVAVSSPAGIPPPRIGAKRQGCGGRATFGAGFKKTITGNFNNLHISVPRMLTSTKVFPNRSVRACSDRCTQMQPALGSERFVHKVIPRIWG